MVLHILACVLNYWYMSTKLTCQLLHTAHASHICCCCHLYHHPNRLFNSVLHTHTRFLSGVLAVLGSAEKSASRPPSEDAAPSTSSIPSVCVATQHSQHENSCHCNCTAHCNAPSQCHIHVMPPSATAHANVGSISWL